MIKDRAYWEAWESQGTRRKPLDPQRALKGAEVRYEHARSSGVFPPTDALAGLETKIALALPAQGGHLYLMDNISFTKQWL
jgi:hypothetical protein